MIDYGEYNAEVANRNGKTPQVRMYSDEDANELVIVADEHLGEGETYEHKVNKGMVMLPYDEVMRLCLSMQRWLNTHESDKTGS